MTNVFVISPALLQRPFKSAFSSFHAADISSTPLCRAGNNRPPPIAGNNLTNIAATPGPPGGGNTAGIVQRKPMDFNEYRDLLRTHTAQSHKSAPSDPTRPQDLARCALYRLPGSITNIQLTLAATAASSASAPADAYHVGALLYDHHWRYVSTVTQSNADALGVSFEKLPSRELGLGLTRALSFTLPDIPVGIAYIVVVVAGSTLGELAFLNLKLQELRDNYSVRQLGQKQVSGLQSGAGVIVAQLVRAGPWWDLFFAQQVTTGVTRLERFATPEVRYQAVPSCAAPRLRCQALTALPCIDCASRH